MTTPDPPVSLSIGEFARLCQLTPKALRLYDEVGLLVPAWTDPANGYRRYLPDQLRRAGIVKLLRGIDLPVAAIGPLLDDLAEDPDRAMARLDAHVARLEAQHQQRRDLVRHLQTVINQEADPMFPIEVHQVPATNVLSIVRHLRVAEADAFLAEAWDAFAAHLGDTATGPFTVLVHGVVDAEHDGPMEAIIACPEGTVGTGQLVVRDEPAHDEARTPVTRAQWDFPAILAAYDAVASSPAVAARPGSALACREVYRMDPRLAGPTDVICDVAFPLA